MVGQAVVIGAGIAGLSVAIGLRKAGWAVTVVERSTALARGGTALGMWPSAIAALDELGVGDEVRRHAVLARGATILAPGGQVLARLGSSRRAHLVSRAHLLDALYAALPEDCVQWGRAAASPLDYSEADLIVGADGIHSPVRGSLWDAPAVRPLNAIAYRGVVSGAATQITETWGEGSLFGITPSSDGLVNWFACIRAGDDSSGTEDPLDYLSRRFSSWHEGVSGVVSRLESDAIDRRELYDLTVPRSFVRGNVALVGDAAHAMAPNLGRGACEALVDAVTLARAMAGGDVATGLQEYNRARRRTRYLVNAARALNRLATAKHTRSLRDATLRTVAKSRELAAHGRDIV